ncbi:hypothetical protein [Gordonia sp. OPL2]|uniref:hypothetical protein n=1 Tax=Gordonia sp. OPL2 TaxID=2486274 RepID=UPI001654E11F|nr:hypothetical protein [Gordonia sp. OPL2]
MTRRTVREKIGGRRARATIWRTPEPGCAWGPGGDLPGHAALCDRVCVVHDPSA